MPAVRGRSPAPGALLAALLGLLSFGCAIPESPQTPKEVLLFSEIGNQFLQDSVSSIAPDGSNFNLLLPRQASRSFLYANGISTKTHLLVIAHEITSNQKVEDHLFLYRPRTGELTRLVNQDGDVGFASLAPDDGRIAFEFVPAGQTFGSQLWLTDLTGQTKALTTSQDAQDRYPVWRPDGSEIWFLRVRFSSGEVNSSLMAVFPAGGDPRVVFGRAEQVGAVAFGPDNERFAIWTARGLEMVEAATLARTVILPSSSLPNYVLQAGSLAWSRKQDLLALALVNTRTGASELWIVASDGTNARPIYRVNNGRLYLGSFVEQ